MAGIEYCSFCCCYRQRNQFVNKNPIPIRKKKVVFVLGQKKAIHFSVCVCIFSESVLFTRDHYNEWVVLLNGTRVPRIWYTLDSLVRWFVHPPIFVSIKPSLITAMMTQPFQTTLLRLVLAVCVMSIYSSSSTTSKFFFNYISSERALCAFLLIANAIVDTVCALRRFFSVFAWDSR